MDAAERLWAELAAAERLTWKAEPKTFVELSIRPKVNEPTKLYKFENLAQAAQWLDVEFGRKKIGPLAMSQRPGNGLRSWLVYRVDGRVCGQMYERYY